MLPALREQTAVTTLLPDGPDVLPVSQELRRSLIAERAYHLAAERNFAPGREMDDWLAAEAEIDRTLRHA